MMWNDGRRLDVCVSIVVCVFFVLFGLSADGFAQTAPSSYSGYTGTDVRTPPNVPPPSSANGVMTDPTFGTRILRVTDQNTAGGTSYVSADSGFTRAFNANATAIKLTESNGFSDWMEFNPGTFKVGDGSSHPVPHAIRDFDARWEWSAVDPDIMYFLKSNTIAKYNKATGASTDLGGPSTGDSVAYHVAVLGADNWVCSAAGNGVQNTFTKIFCVNPSNPSQVKLIDILARTINGAGQTDPLWPTSASGQTIGIHGLYGSAGGSWLGVSFHGQNWGGNGDCVFNLNTNHWSLVTDADYYWSGHVSLGNGKFVNGAGSQDGRDARGALVRDPDDLMNASKYQFIMQPPSTCCWNDGEHSSWFNSSTNPAAPILFSRYTSTASPWLAWMSELILAATDGSNTVWRVAHTHQGGCYYGQAHAQISNDGKWALFSSYWDGTLGSPAGFDCSSRIDTFLVELPAAGAGGSSSPSPSGPSPSAPSPAPSPSPSPTPTASASAVQWTSLVDTSASGSVLTKTSGCAGCASGAVSAQQIASGDGYVEFTASETDTLRSIGLSNGNPGTSAAEIKFAIQMQGGWAEARESGVYKADTSFSTGDVLRVAVSGGKVRYSKNGAVFYTSTSTPAYPLLVDTSLSDLNATITNAVIGAGGGTASQPMTVIDGPIAGGVVEPFNLNGWAVDAAAASGTGVDAVHVWAYPASGAPPVFVGGATYGTNRPDVATVLGSDRFNKSGYTINVNNLPPGGYRLVVFAHSAVTNTFADFREVNVNVNSSILVFADSPVPGASVSSTFNVTGWATDLHTTSGSGIDAVHVYVRSQATGAYTFLGGATIGSGRPDVASLLGSQQFNGSGYALTASGVAPGGYDLTIFARSTATQQWNATILPIVVR